SALSEHNTRFGGMNCHRHLVCGGALNLNLRDSSIRQLLVNPFANLKVLGQQIFIVALSVPAGLPVFDDAEPETDGMDFVSQISSPPCRVLIQWGLDLSRPGVFRVV